MVPVETVLSLADGRTPAEIAKATGLPLPEVMKALNFLMKFSFVKSQGLTIVVDEALKSLPTAR